MRLAGRHTLVVALIVALAAAAEYDEAEQSSPQQRLSPGGRPSLLRRPAGLPLVGRAAGGKGVATPTATTTTTTTPQPYRDDEEEFEDEAPLDGEDGEPQEEQPQTTTPAGRRIKGGVVRPFRSNDDLLAALKRRRAEAASGKSHHHEAASVPAAAEPPAEVQPSSKNNAVGRRRFNQPSRSEPSPQSTEAPSAPQSAAGRSSRNRFSARGLYKANSGDSEISGLESNQQPVEVKPRPGSGFKPGQRRF